MRIAVVGGTGYVGLTTAVCLASKGHLVFCVGRNKEKIERIRKGSPVTYERGLKSLLDEIMAKGTFVATVDLKNAIQNSDVSFICVGTPCGNDGGIDLTQIKDVAKQIGYALGDKVGYHVVVVKSTVVPGTTDDVVLPILEKFSAKKAGIDFGICMNPEFLREGRAIDDFMFPKDVGIVIGISDQKSGDLVSKIYEGYDVEIQRTSIRTAEMIKYARNSYLAKDISFANEVANICQKLGVDYLDVKKGMELDARIGRGRFLNAGAGFGGSCFPKDVKAIVAKAKGLGIAPTLLESTLRVNESQPYELVKLTKEVVGNPIKGKSVAVLGLAFKPGTDDIREAPSIKVIDSLLREGCEISVYDSKAVDNAKKIFGDKVAYAEKADEALRGADACVIVTEWAEFTNPKLYASMRGRVIIDGRRVLNPATLPPGFIYHGIGVPKAVKT
jgi:UDPglucose 6-dehydrogenase